jgi:glycerate 2-kinase
MSGERTLRKHAQLIFRAALAAADPAKAVARHMRPQNGVLIAGGARYRLRDFDKIHVIGAGKAAAAMAAKAGPWGAQQGAAFLNVKYGHAQPKLRWIEQNECGHPVPDANGVRGAERIAEIAAAAGPRDLVICLISGGASALLPLPAAPVTLVEKQASTKLLLACGASIHEINAVRKHISRIKGGQLAAMASPARVLALILSDVVGDDLDVIGSGITAPDASTFADVQGILSKYTIEKKAPAAVRDRIQRGMRGEIPETPKPGHPAFSHTQNLIVGSNAQAVEAAQTRARGLGYRTLILSTEIEGETRDVGRMHAAIAKEIMHRGRPVKPPACVISGGETTVTLRGPGLGGRNQEFTLAAAIDIAGRENIVILSGGTDGTDGPTEAAGAIADGNTLARALQKGLSAQHALAQNDSYRFFQPLGDLLVTGPTGTNVMDVHLILAGDPAALQ